ERRRHDQRGQAGRRRGPAQRAEVDRLGLVHGPHDGPDLARGVGAPADDQAPVADRPGRGRAAEARQVQQRPPGGGRERPAPGRAVAGTPRARVGLAPRRRWLTSPLGLAAFGRPTRSTDSTPWRRRPVVVVAGPIRWTRASPKRSTSATATATAGSGSAIVVS